MERKKRKYTKRAVKDEAKPEESEKKITPEDEKRVDELVASYKKKGGVFLVAVHDKSKHGDGEKVCHDAIFMTDASGSFIANTLCAAIKTMLEKQPFMIRMALMEAIMLAALKD